MSAFKMLALTSVFLATTFAQTEWKEFTSRDGNFRVLFPDNPQQQTGTERNLHQFSAAADSESYGLAYADYVIENTCPHRGGPLAEGMVAGDEVICPWHSSRFNIKTGAVLSPPAREGVKSFAVRVTEHDVEVEIG